MTKVKFKTIVSIAEKIKSHVEKEHELPGKVTVGKVDYSYPVAGYLIAKSINNLGKDITLISVAKAPNPSGISVDLRLDKSQYKKLAKDLAAFIEKKKRLPNYHNYNGKHIKKRVYIYSLAKILVWYKNNKNTLPAYCDFKTSQTVGTKKTTTTTSSKSTTTKKTTSTKKKYGHATKSGCDNRGQNTGYYCGCHSLQEVFRNLTGKVVPQKTIASVCGTTSSGTDHAGLNTCVAWFNKKYGFNLKVEWKNFSDLGWNGVKKIVNSDNKDCIIHNLYRNKWGHYEVINSVSDSNIKVQNSLGDSGCSGCYCGYVEDRTPAAFRSYIAGISQKSVMIITKN